MSLISFRVGFVILNPLFPAEHLPIVQLISRLGRQAVIYARFDDGTGAWIALTDDIQIRLGSANEFLKIRA